MRNSIGNIAHALFVADFFDIPLKDDGNDDDDDDDAARSGGLTVHEVYDALAHLFEYVFLDTDEARSYKRHAVAARDTQALAAVMRRVVEGVRAGPGLLHLLADLLLPFGVGAAKKGKGKGGPAGRLSLPGGGGALVARLLESAKSVEDLVWEIIPTQAAAAATQAQAVSLPPPPFLSFLLLFPSFLFPSLLFPSLLISAPSPSLLSSSLSKTKKVPEC